MWCAHVCCYVLVYTVGTCGVSFEWFYCCTEDMPPGQTPHTVVLYAYHDLVDSVQPGDRVTVTGIYRATSLRVNPRIRAVKAVYKTYVDAIHFKKDTKGRLKSREDEDEEG